MKAELMQMIKLLHDEMEQLTIDAGVSPEIYEAIVKYDDDVDHDDLWALHNWLDLVFDLYLEVRKVWLLHPKRRWDYYYSLGEELKEMRLLNSKRKKLNEAWKKPYYAKGCKKHVKGLRVQSEQSGADGDNLGQLGPEVLGTASAGTDS